MKKILAILLICAFAATAVACAPKPVQGNNPQNSQETQPTPTPRPSATPADEPDPDAFQPGFWQSNIYYNGWAKISLKLPEEMIKMDTASEEYRRNIAEEIRDIANYDIMALTPNQNGYFVVAAFEKTGDFSRYTEKDFFNLLVAKDKENYGEKNVTTTDDGIAVLGGREYSKMICHIDMSKEAEYKGEATYYFAPVNDRYILLIGTYLETGTSDPDTSRDDAALLNSIVSSIELYMGK